MEHELSETAAEIRATLKAHGLRATKPRLAVLRLLSKAHEPLSCTEALRELEGQGVTLVTIYRNMVRLKEAGIVKVVSKAHGCDHYALTEREPTDDHPHFECLDCGRTTCLPRAPSATSSPVSPGSSCSRSSSTSASSSTPTTTGPPDRTTATTTTSDTLALYPTTGRSS